MAKFSADQGVRGARFSPATGNVGAQAAQKAMHPTRQGAARPTAAPAKKAAPERLGHPVFPEERQEAPRDNRHLEPIGQHFNMRGLGRDVPFGVWASLTGSYRQWAKPGQLPFDIFEDS